MNTIDTQAQPNALAKSSLSFLSKITIFLAVVVFASISVAELILDSSLDEPFIQKIEHDLKFLEDLHFSQLTSLAQERFGDNAKGVFSQYIHNNTTRMQLQTDPDRLASGALLNADIFDSSINVYRPQMLMSFDTVLRLSFIVHEVAHIVTGSVHWNCPTPYLGEDGKPVTDFSGEDISGLPACDRDIEGAYPTQAVFLANVARYCTNCDAKTKADAENAFLQVIKRIPADDLREKIRSELK